jgi:hypothetical protein
MAKEALLDFDPLTRRKTEYAEEDGKTYIVTRQDCEGIVEAAKALSELPQGKDFKHVAIIPQEVLNQAFLEGWFHDKDRWRKWANDPDNRDFRVSGGRL